MNLSRLEADEALRVLLVGYLRAHGAAAAAALLAEAFDAESAPPVPTDDGSLPPTEQAHWSGLDALAEAVESLRRPAPAPPPLAAPTDPDVIPF